MQLTDNHRSPLRSGEIYANAKSLDSFSGRIPYLYHVFRQGQKWMAKDVSGKVYEVSYPKGMPDSSIMPDGEIDSSNLVRLSRQGANKILEEMIAHRAKASEIISFLEQQPQ